MLQSAADKLAQVTSEKQGSSAVITNNDANRISSAESKLTGGRAKGGLAAQAQNAAVKAQQAGLD